MIDLIKELSHLDDYLKTRQSQTQKSRLSMIPEALRKHSALQEMKQAVASMFLVKMAFNNDPKLFEEAFNEALAGFINDVESVKEREASEKG